MQQVDYEIDTWDKIEGVSDPRSSQSLVGHDEQFAMLCERFHQGNLHHAWLLSGPRGVGKATFAFRFAEHLLRSSQEDQPPKQFEFIDCSIHSQVAKGGHPNLLVLRRPYDLKSKKFKTQLTVEEVRKTQRFFGTTSGAESWRICIVDPADDLNKSAANALLKVLEEPPKNTIFFVLAHSPRGLLPTIRSRCQLLHFKPLADSDIRHLLDKKGALDGVSEAKLEQVIKYSAGSIRRAIVLLRSEAIGNLEKFVSAANNGSRDVSDIYKLASTISLAKNADEYQLFWDLYRDHLTGLIRNPEIGKKSELLNQVTELWEDVNVHTRRADQWNLDKKQVVLSTFSNLRSFYAMV